MKLREIHDTIEKYLPIKTKEKNKNGEVFTPLLLIEEMLNQLPVDVWTNPDLTWLDPANGVGNFPMIVYSLLMNGLKYWQPNDKKRSNHIIKNMLFMVELNQVNVDVSRGIFGDDANIFCGSFLEEDWLDVFPKQFDIIIGNPPFNKEVTGVRVGSYGGRTLWNKFIIKSFDVLKPNGYLTFINPANWRGLGQTHNIWDLLTKKQILYLHIYGISGGKEIFKVGSRFDVYLVQNKPVFKETDIIDEMGETHQIRLDTLNFLPNYAYDLIFPLLTDEGIDVIYSRSAYGTDKNHMNKTKTSTHNYPIIHSINKNGTESRWYSNDNTKGHFGVPKVILNFNVKQYSHPEQNDWEGKYGMSHISFGIPITNKEEGDMILKAIETDTFKTIIKATKWTTFQTDHRMFKHFKKDFWKLLCAFSPTI